MIKDLSKRYGQKYASRRKSHDPSLKIEIKHELENNDDPMEESCEDEGENPGFTVCYFFLCSLNILNHMYTSHSTLFSLLHVSKATPMMRKHI